MARRCSVERANQQIGSFASAKKNLIIQYQGRERSEKHLLDLIYQDIYGANRIYRRQADMIKAACREEPS